MLVPIGSTSGNQARLPKYPIDYFKLIFITILKNTHIIFRNTMRSSSAEEGRDETSTQPNRNEKNQNENNNKISSDTNTTNNTNSSAPRPSLRIATRLFGSIRNHLRSSSWDEQCPRTSSTNPHGIIESSSHWSHAQNHRIEAQRHRSIIRPTRKSKIHGHHLIINSLCIHRL
jgi:hypothetical protein